MTMGMKYMSVDATRRFVRRMTVVAVGSSFGFVAIALRLPAVRACVGKAEREASTAECRSTFQCLGTHGCIDADNIDLFCIAWRHP